ncbi:OmpA family protein [Paracoccus jiaweipingae]|uniref:OmpA family protein n=1 Tax=unclassified Paracoccus (in: a-proteobacteria) TaxID=2688777 RepID=UPI00378EEC80
MSNPPSPQRRPGAVLARLAVLAGAGGLCWLAAQQAANLIEQRTAQDATQALAQSGQDWVQVQADGLRLRLSGTAPDEVARFRARNRVEAVIDPTRVVDEMTVRPRQYLAPPDFRVEMLRNDDMISLIGLVPAETDRRAVLDRLRREAGASEVTDLLEAADYAIPRRWSPAFDFGLRAAAMARRAKVTILDGSVTVTAITDSAAQKARLEAALRRAKPDGVGLVTDISAPRPVIAPFTLRLVKDAGGLHFDACSADSDAARDRILAAAAQAGVTGQPVCTVGLGAPTTQWATGAVAAIRALAALGAGSVTISDADVALQAPASVAQAQLDEVAARLETALPAIFTLKAEREAAGPAGPAEFTARIGRDDLLQLRGRVPDARMRDVVVSMAQTRFGKVDDALRVDDTVPPGWTLRIIAALEAMDGLREGGIEVTPALIRISGVSGSRTASDQVATRLAQRLGAGADYQLAIRYDPRLDPAMGLPDGAQCVDRLNKAMAGAEIGFEPNKARISGDTAPLMAALEKAMADCDVFRIEIGGHTDSQGPEDFNQKLSHDRALAVRAAMEKAGIPVALIRAAGYGESQPIADNDTEAGREANRRIAFTLLSDMPVQAGPQPAADVVAGVTAEPAQPRVPAPAQVAPATDLAVPFAPVLLPGQMPPQIAAGGAITRPEADASAPFGLPDQVPVHAAGADTPRPEPRPATPGAASPKD